MFRKRGIGFEIPYKTNSTPLSVSNCADVIPGFRAYSSDQIGPFSVSVNDTLFGQGKRNDVKIHSTQECKAHEQNIYGDFRNYYTPASFEREINSRVEAKLEEYAENLVRRRQRLKNLMAKEEYEQIKEIVDIAQRGQEHFLRDAKIRTQQLRAKREIERLELVKEKKLQQYLEKCEEFRPILENRRLKETKEAQRMQILEKQNQERNEKEINHMWYEILMKEIEAQAEREQQDNLALRRRNLEDKNTWDIQCKKRELEKQDKLRETREDAIKLDNLKEELRRDEIKELDEKRRKRDECYRNTMAQIKEKQESLAKQVLEEKIFQQNYNKLQQEEIEKEQVFGEKERLNQEFKLYYDYILRLDQERKDEEKRLDELIEQELKEIQQKQDEARQKYQKARQALQKTVLKDRKEQLDHKKEEAEQQLKLKQAENQMLEMARDQNERMRAEYVRKQILAAQQYREDLKQQIEYAKLIKENEMNQIEKQLLQGQIEEEEYKRNLIKIINSDIKVSEIHPFRQVVTKERIPCPKNLYY